MYTVNEPDWTALLEEMNRHIEQLVVLGANSFARSEAEVQRRKLIDRITQNEDAGVPRP